MRNYIPIISVTITAIVAVITLFLSPVLANLKDKKEFKRKHNYEQLKELYFEVYGIVIQSEYFRYYFRTFKDFNIGIIEAPFLEIHLKRVTMINLHSIEEEVMNDFSENN
ncbi:hypothetical protein [Neobacillus sp. YIM B06451]|uniref:hypothetical protein n=1 Tax=Neobacillus sp. YIM B06451 TaxID=3070994 RepID=UPI00293195E1|nr:hypothetical protein [Neobacillus sp. YIM B06451]